MTFIYTSQSHSSSSQRLQLPQGFGAVSQDIAQYAAKVTHQNLHSKFAEFVTHVGCVTFHPPPWCSIIYCSMIVYHIILDNFVYNSKICLKFFCHFNEPQLNLSHMFAYITVRGGYLPESPSQNGLCDAPLFCSTNLMASFFSKHCHRLNVILTDQPFDTLLVS